MLKGSDLMQKLFQTAIKCSKLAIGNTRTRCGICSKLTIVSFIVSFIVNFEHFSNFVLVFLLLTLINVYWGAHLSLSAQDLMFVFG